MTQLSDRKVNEAAVPAVPNPANVDGIVKCKWFEGTITTARVLTAGVLITLCSLPKGARIIGGLWGNDAVFSGGSTLIDIGYPDDPNAFLAAFDTTALNDTLMANTKALGRGLVLTKEEVISATTTAVDIVNAGTFYGYFLYI